MKRNEIVGYTEYYKVSLIDGDVAQLTNIFSGEVKSVNIKDNAYALSETNKSTEEVAVSKTDLISIMSNTSPLPFTVEFVKQDGTARTLTAIFEKAEPHFGRSVVYDLEDNSIKQVDNRTVESLVFNKKKFVVK